jgi:hypothetical protein
MEDFSCPLGNKAGSETFIGILTGFQSSYGVSGNLISMLVAQRELVTSKHTNNPFRAWLEVSICPVNSLSASGMNRS